MCSMRSGRGGAAVGGGAPPASSAASARQRRSARAFTTRSGPADAPRYGRLPELDLVAVGVDEPAEASILVLFDLADDLGTAEMHLSERAVEIVDDQVEHERARRRRKIVGI